MSKCSIIHKVLSVLFPCLAMNLLQKLLRTIQVLKIVDFWCGKCSWADALQTWQSKKTWFLTLAERAQFESPTATVGTLPTLYISRETFALPYRLLGGEAKDDISPCRMIYLLLHIGIRILLMMNTIPCLRRMNLNWYKNQNMDFRFWQNVILF